MTEWKGKYILIVIDGTSSKELSYEDKCRNHCYRFYKDFVSNYGPKKYIDGPNVNGTGVEAITQDCVKFANNSIKIFLKQGLSKPFISLSATLKKKLLKKGKDKLRIVIVGHSRGGFIAIKVAKQLFYPVYFLGLYDAVDMYRAGVLKEDDEKEVRNVDFPYHAIRELPRRVLGVEWDNVGGNLSNKFKRVKKAKCYLTSIDGEKIIVRKFKTSHGGMNGLVDPTPQHLIADDFSCSLLKSNSFVEINGYRLRKNGGVTRMCLTESNEVDEWMRGKAQSLGLKFSN